jgi:hypothetical protein
VPIPTLLSSFSTSQQSLDTVWRLCQPSRQNTLGSKRGFSKPYAAKQRIRKSHRTRVGKMYHRKLLWIRSRYGVILSFRTFNCHKVQYSLCPSEHPRATVLRRVFLQVVISRRAPAYLSIWHGGVFISAPASPRDAAGKGEVLCSTASGRTVDSSRIFRSRPARQGWYERIRQQAL